MFQNHTVQKVAIENSHLTFDVEPGDTILGGLLRAGIGAPYECNAGGCGSCKYSLVTGEVIDDFDDCSGLKRSDKRKNRHLACISRPTTDCTIGIKIDPLYQPKTTPKKVDGSLHSIRKLTHDLWEFRFRSSEQAKFLPGQYAKVTIPGIKGPRSYSMSNTANTDGEWSFQVKKMPGGAASEILFSQENPNLSVTIDAPYSIAHLQTDSERPVICVGGGSGLAPMVSILHGLGQRGLPETAPILYYGARSSIDVVDKKFFQTIPHFSPDDQYVPIVSEPNQGCNWSGGTGLMHEFLRENLDDEACESEFYLAGPPLMVDAVRRHLVLDRGVPVEQLHYDRFY